MFNLRLALILALATLSGCETTDRPRFEDMSEYELVLHNALSVSYTHLRAHET